MKKRREDGEIKKLKCHWTDAAHSWWWLPSQALEDVEKGKDALMKCFSLREWQPKRPVMGEVVTRGLYGRIGTATEIDSIERGCNALSSMSLSVCFCCFSCFVSIGKAQWAVEQWKRCSVICNADQTRLHSVWTSRWPLLARGLSWLVPASYFFSLSRYRLQQFFVSLCVYFVCFWCQQVLLFTHSVFGESSKRWESWLTSALMAPAKRLLKTTRYCRPNGWEKYGQCLLCLTANMVQYTTTDRQTMLLTTLVFRQISRETPAWMATDDRVAGAMAAQENKSTTRNEH